MKVNTNASQDEVEDADAGIYVMFERGVAIDWETDDD